MISRNEDNISYTVPPTSISISYGTGTIVPSLVLHSSQIYLVKPPNSIVLIIASRTFSSLAILVGIPSRLPLRRPVNLLMRSRACIDISLVDALYDHCGLLTR